MRPGNFHGAGMPTKLPNGTPVLDKNGSVVFDGKTVSFTKLQSGLKAHFATVLGSRSKRDRP